jgi:hypothetical protein
VSLSLQDRVATVIDPHPHAPASADMRSLAPLSVSLLELLCYVLFQLNANGKGPRESRREGDVKKRGVCFCAGDAMESGA